MNGLKNVKLHNLAVLDKEGHKELVISGWNMGGHSFYPIEQGNQQKIRFKTISLKNN